jgi:UPF0755 protein
MRWLKAGAWAVLLYVVAIAAIFTIELQPQSKNSSTKQDIKIEQNASRLSVAKELKNKNLIKSDFFFYAYLKLTKSTILPGVYELSPSTSATMIAQTISSGKSKTVKVTFIEGWRATDMEKYLVEERNLSQMVGFASKAQNYEGYVFPDTYDLKVEITQDELLQEMLDNFKERTKDLKLAPDLVSLAAIVEREAANDNERQAIAAVYANRMKQGMKLEADPTIQYALGNWKAVTLSQYRSVISPYNTYLNDGLPPGPICNPGLASLRAATTPEDHSYLYFFHAKGETYFSNTYEEHTAKVRKYFN